MAWLWLLRKLGSSKQPAGPPNKGVEQQHVSTGYAPNQAQSHVNFGEHEETVSYLSHFIELRPVQVSTVDFQTTSTSAGIVGE